MIKLEDIVVEVHKSEEYWEWRGRLNLEVRHREPTTSVEMANLDVQAKIEETIKNSILRYLYEDIVPLTHDMHKLAAGYLPTHIAVQFAGKMDFLMDIFLGIQPGRKH